MKTTIASVGLGGEATSTESKIKRHSMLLRDSDSEDEIIVTSRLESAGIIPDQVVDFFAPFVNKLTNKDAGYRLQKLKKFREDSQMQTLAKAVFDFRMDD